MAQDTTAQEIYLPELTDQPNIAVLATALQAILERTSLRFASATERAATLPAPIEGMITWLEDVNRLEFYNGSAWRSILNGGGWQSYNPAWTASTTNPVIGNGSIAGEYSRIGDSVDFSVKITLGSSTTLGSGPWSVSLPVQAAVAVDRIGSVMVGDASGTSMYSFGAAYIPAGGQTASLYAGGLHDGALISATHPQAWANGDRLWVSGTYRAL